MCIAADRVLTKDAFFDKTQSLIETTGACVIAEHLKKHTVKAEGLECVHEQKQARLGSNTLS